LIPPKGLAVNAGTVVAGMVVLAVVVAPGPDTTVQEVALYVFSVTPLGLVVAAIGVGGDAVNVLAGMRDIMM
jgi:hypothetical protein